MLVNPLSKKAGMQPVIKVTAPNGSTVVAKAMKPNPEYKELPNGYTQVEYIEVSNSPDNQYAILDTGFKTNQLLDNTLYVKGQSTIGNWPLRFGVYNTSSNQLYYEMHSTRGSVFYGGSGNSVSFGSYDSNVHVFSITATATQAVKVGIDGSEKNLALANANTIPNGYSIFLAGYSSTDQAHAGKYFGAYLESKSNPGAYVGYLVPAIRDSDNIAGMYDIVKGTFIAALNSGSGASYNFLAGPKVIQFLPDPQGKQYTPKIEVGTSKSIYIFTVPVGGYTINGILGEKTDSVEVVVDNVALYEIALKFSRLPKGYTEVEYIETGGAGKAYIATGISPSVLTNYYIESKVKLNSTSSVAAIWGSASGIDSVGNGIVPYLRGPNGYISLTYKGGSRDFVSSDLNEHVIRFSYGIPYTLYIDGAEYRAGNTSSNYLQYIYIHLFAANGNASSALYIGDMRMYYTKFIPRAAGETTLYKDFVPCIRESDDVAGMLELISGTFYASANSYQFIAGPEV